VIQVLLNLLTNAVKYNTANGSVAVDSEVVANGNVEIKVSDTGIGILEADMSRLFRPFDRIGAEGTGVEGTGIGLTLAAALATAMGGSIEVRSEVGVGSTFSLILPAATREAVNAVPEPPSPRDPAAAIDVLYIEDHPANRELMESVFALRPAAKLMMAEQGLIGVEMASADPPDLVLLDLHLPDVSGEEVLRLLKSRSATADVPVVVVTADVSMDVRRRLEALGADGFLPKPFELAVLLKLIDDSAAAILWQPRQLGGQRALR
jgi:CheY-like chemotaxis protein